MTNPTHWTIVLIGYLGLGNATRVWAIDREELQFFTRIGSHQMQADTPPLTHAQTEGRAWSSQPLDIGAGMHYHRGGVRLQLGPRYDLSTPSLQAPQKVTVEGQIGLTW